MVNRERLEKLVGKNIGVLYTTSFGNAKTAAGYLHIENGFMYLYDKDRQGSGYNFALYIKGKREMKRLLQIHELPEQFYQEVVVNNVRSFLLHKPNFIPDYTDGNKIIHYTLPAPFEFYTSK